MHFYPYDCAALAPVEPTVPIDHQTLDEDTKLWLESLECDVSHQNFVQKTMVNDCVMVIIIISYG